MYSNNRILNALAGVLLSMVSFSVLILTLPSAKASDSVVDNVTIDVPVSCSMSATGNTSHNATVQNGATVSDIGTTNIKVICNDNSGYAIYAIGYTDDTYGKTVLTSSTLGSTHDIATATTVTTGTSSWAMKLASQTGTYAPTIVTDYASYHAVPAEYTKVAYLTSSTDTGTNAAGSNLTTTYRTYISQTQPAGTYIGQVKYTLVHPNMTNNSNKPPAPLQASDCPGGWVCYAPNSSEIIGSMDSLSSTKITSSPKAGKINVGTGATSISLIAPNYKREGYGFAGWSTKWDATTATNPIIYGPNETITVADLPTNENITFSSKGLILYPVWIASAGNLQGWSGCSSLTQASINTRATLASMTALTDTRDNNVYAVARLADGKCWMTENLRLNNEATITAANTQSNNGSFGGVFTSLPQSADATWDSNTSNNLYTGLTAYTLPQLNTNNTNIGGKNASGTDLSISHNNSNDHAQWYSYGNYYSWAAAIADTTAHTSNNEHVSNTSICPTNWHLPEGGDKDNKTNSEFWALGVSLTGDEPANTSSQTRPYYTGNPEGYNASMAFRKFPNNFIYSGYWYSSSALSRGNSGYYWSSSACGSNVAYNLYFSSSDVNPGTDNFGKRFGLTVRCVAGS